MNSIILRQHWTWILALGLLAGCECGSGTVGDPCTTDRDCDRGQFCNLTTGLCEPIPADDAGPDVDGGDTDGGGCVDADADGVTDCAGDCDDADPFTYPGAVEVCGDGIDNSCGSSPDNGCGGIGTFVAEPPTGVDTNPGTQAMPVATIGQGMTNAATIGGGTDVFVAAGTYNEDITMVEGTTLFGGYEASGWTRDPAANTTTIDATTAAGVVFPSGITRATAIDGFTVLGASGGGTATSITIMDGASPTVSNNIVMGASAGGASIGIEVNPADNANTGTPLIENNEIRIGTSAGGWGADRGGYGIRSRQTVLEILGNSIFFADDDTIQQAIQLATSPPTSTIDGNTIRGTGTADFPFGIRIGGSNVIVSNNDVAVGDSFQGGRGIATAGEGITQRIENNIVFGGNGPQRTIAFAVEYEVMIPSPPPDLTVHSNFFHGGSGSGTTVGIEFGECPSSAFQVGRFFNNIVHSGEGDIRYAVAEVHPNIDPVAFENNALYRAPGGTSGGIYRDEGLPSALMCVPAGSGSDVMLGAVNGLTGYAMNLEDDCSLASPVPDGDFHLGSGSVCVDAGSATDAPTNDYEGDARPSGSAPDIGVDES